MIIFRQTADLVHSNYFKMEVAKESLLIGGIPSTSPIPISSPIDGGGGGGGGGEAHGIWGSGCQRPRLGDLGQGLGVNPSFMLVLPDQSLFPYPSGRGSRALFQYICHSG